MNEPIKKTLTLKELLKSDAVSQNSIPEKFPVEMANKRVKEWSVVDDDITGDKYDEKLLYKLEGEHHFRSISLKQHESIEQKDRDKIYDRLSENDDKEAIKEYSKFVEKVYQVTKYIEPSIER